MLQWDARGRLQGRAARPRAAVDQPPAGSTALCKVEVTYRLVWAANAAGDNHGAITDFLYFVGRSVFGGLL